MAFLLTDSVIYANTRFRARVSGQPSLNNNETVVFDSVDYDTSNSYNNSTGFWTTPVNGFYKINVRLRMLIDVGQNVGVIIKKNSANYSSNFSTTNSGTGVVSSSDTLYLQKGETINIAASFGGTGNKDVTGTTFYNIFTIERVADFSAGQSIGFGLASGTKPGLVSSESEGDWTPVVKVGTTAQATSTAVGSWYRIGKQVTVMFRVVISGVSGTGNVVIEGLPFPFKNVSGQNLYFPIGTNRVISPNDLPIILDAAPGTTTAVLRGSNNTNNNMANITNANIFTNTQLRASFTYITD